MSATAPQSRRYRGVTPEERRAQRRERLLAAGLELFGTRGYANTSIRQVCVEAGLNQRYFYESFCSPEELLLATREQIVAELYRTAIPQAAAAESPEDKARAGLTVWWKLLTDDPRKGRVMFIEVVGVSDALEQRRLQSRHQLADFIVAQGSMLYGFTGAEEWQVDATLTARSLVGATVELLVDWLHGEFDRPVEDLIDHCVRMYMLAGEAARAAR